MSRSLSKQFEDHERKDAERFDAGDLRMRRIEDKIDQLPTKEDLQPIIDAWVTVKNGRNGLLWVAITITAVGGAIAAIKGVFR